MLHTVHKVGWTIVKYLKVLPLVTLSFCRFVTQEVFLKQFLVESLQKFDWLSIGCLLRDKNRETYWKATKETEAKGQHEGSASTEQQTMWHWWEGQGYEGQLIGKGAAGVSHCLAIQTRPLLHTLVVKGNRGGTHQNKTQILNMSTLYSITCVNISNLSNDIFYPLPMQWHFMCFHMLIWNVHNKLSVGLASSPLKD